MLPAVATVGAAALAASTVLVPVTALGDAGWNKAGSGTYEIQFGPTTVDFSKAEGGGADMKLAKLGAASLDSLFPVIDGTSERQMPVIEAEGEDHAHLAFRAWVNTGTFLPKFEYTAIVFTSDPAVPVGNQVQLTWGSAEDEYMTFDQFETWLNQYDGVAYQVEIGHTDTSSTSAKSTSVDSITFGDYTFDFGTGSQEPGMPGNGNRPDGPGQGNGNNGNGGTPPGQVDKDKNQA